MAILETGSRIRDLRTAAGLSQEQLAELSSLNRVTIAKYEAGRVEPGAQALSRIADALDVSTDALLGRSDDSPETTKAPHTTPQIRIVSSMMLDLSKEIQDQIVAIVDAVVTHQKGKEYTNDQ